ncbi:Mg/Co/Ni transporter MgtE [Pedobacter sp. W3I1]|uniref:CBS domain-containing protein n=1 Tax=Pedobacter sp. W3I1 TaxID=3042291 RepID=UPI002781D829|nr:CBS domain-containing protein [Pedobacter sp. W3I1]MDQ0638000.1 Mg/Co/Ni transporter MgtE [Pedobacter sp. W3I1]
MFAAEIISDAIPSLKAGDTVQKALDRMNDFKLKHLPVVNEVTLLGLVSEDDLLNVDNHDTLLSDSSVNMLNVFVLSNMHTYDVIRLIESAKINRCSRFRSTKKLCGFNIYQ